MAGRLVWSSSAVVRDKFLKARGKHLRARCRNIPSLLHVSQHLARQDPGLWTRWAAKICWLRVLQQHSLEEGWRAGLWQRLAVPGHGKWPLVCIRPQPRCTTRGTSVLLLPTVLVPGCPSLSQRCPLHVVSSPPLGSMCVKGFEELLGYHQKLTSS